jgi:hypothetical protein
VTKAAVNEWKRSSEVVGAIEGKVKLTLLESFQPTHASEIAKHFRKLFGKAERWDEETREQVVEWVEACEDGNNSFLNFLN